MTGAGIVRGSSWFTSSGRYHASSRSLLMSVSLFLSNRMRRRFGVWRRKIHRQGACSASIQLSKLINIYISVKTILLNHTATLVRSTTGMTYVSYYNFSDANQRTWYAYRHDETHTNSHSPTIINFTVHTISQRLSLVNNNEINCYRSRFCASACYRRPYCG
jgi:hypothetical protein